MAWDPKCRLDGRNFDEWLKAWQTQVTKRDKTWQQPKRLPENQGRKYTEDNWLKWIQLWWLTAWSWCDCEHPRHATNQANMLNQSTQKCTILSTLMLRVCFCTFSIKIISDKKDKESKRNKVLKIKYLGGCLVAGKTKITNKKNHYWQSSCVLLTQLSFTLMNSEENCEDLIKCPSPWLFRVRVSNSFMHLCAVDP